MSEINFTAENEKVAMIETLKDEHAVKIFKEIASVPRYLSIRATAVDGALHLSATLSIRDEAKKSKSKLCVNLVYSNGSTTKDLPTPLDETSGLVSTSPTGLKKAILKTVGEKRYINVISASSFDSFDVSKTHGDFYNDGF